MLVFRMFHLACCFFFFFKQKTAYEMRISDWSSDVCSSDLTAAAAIEPAFPEPPPTPAPVSAATPEASGNDAAAEAANDAGETAVPPEVAQTPVTGAPAPTTPSVPSRSAAVPVGAGATLVLKQRTPVRVSPTARAKVFAILPAGTAFTRGSRVIHDGSGSWCFVEAGTITGWVPIEATQP